MNGFIYNGQSTKNIIGSSELILATFDSVDSVTGHERDDMSGEPTISRPIANEYGTQYQSLEFEYGLIKKDRSSFSTEEQHIVERWLTSPKLSQELQIIDCNGDLVDGIYHGKFLSTEWYPSKDGWVGLMFKFQNNTSYPTKHFSEAYQIRGAGQITVKCETDELEEYIYPTITIIEPTETANVTITSITDNSNSMTVNARHELPMIFDCQHCIPRDGTTSGIFTYEDLGWTDVGNIYWLRLLPGENRLSVTGNANITIEFDYPYKKVGVWV